eukprot:NODE_196_length_1931_cov_99.625831_g172_i0.p1 GENE.NODE_196_length_1931_cov_99.625831_g172_i0~~NODE_196_length_1931_cov_99.625831_g172_i0.p1  ORF type:complete len:475 (+),score=57.11 NODE_196_length_1931_cov_99.625831_g172_i0:314-1738(+)
MDEDLLDTILDGEEEDYDDGQVDPEPEETEKVTTSLPDGEANQHATDSTTKKESDTTERHGRTRSRFSEDDARERDRSPRRGNQENSIRERDSEPRRERSTGQQQQYSSSQGAQSPSTSSPNAVRKPFSVQGPSRPPSQPAVPARLGNRGPPNFSSSAPKNFNSDSTLKFHVSPPADNVRPNQQSDQVRPGLNPQNGQPQHVEGNRVSSKGTRFFVMKSFDVINLEKSYREGMWATKVTNQMPLQQGFETGTVILFFSANGSGGFQGYAKMTSNFGDVKYTPAWTRGTPRISEPFQVQWMKVAFLSFQMIRHITNPLNENQRIAISRDGQELTPEIGEELLDKYSTLSSNSFQQPEPRYPPAQQRNPPSGYYQEPQYQPPYDQYNGPPSYQGRYRGNPAPTDFSYGPPADRYPPEFRQYPDGPPASSPQFHAPRFGDSVPRNQRPRFALNMPPRGPPTNAQGFQQPGTDSRFRY